MSNKTWKEQILKRTPTQWALAVLQTTNEFRFGTREQTSLCCNLGRWDDVTVYCLFTPISKWWYRKVKKKKKFLLVRVPFILISWLDRLVFVPHWTETAGVTPFSSDLRILVNFLGVVLVAVYVEPDGCSCAACTAETENYPGPIGEDDPEALRESARQTQAIKRNENHVEV